MKGRVFDQNEEEVAVFSLLMATLCFSTNFKLPRSICVIVYSRVLQQTVLITRGSARICPTGGGLGSPTRGL